MAYLYKLWPWVEANKNRLIGAGIIAVIAGFIISFYFWRQNQNEIAAGEALTEAGIDFVHALAVGDGDGHALPQSVLALPRCSS